MAKCKCLGCGERFEKGGMIQTPKGRFHSYSCATTYAIKKEKKASERKLLKAQSDQKKADIKWKKDNNIKGRIVLTKRACHAYIRYRDREEPCICCGEPLGEEYHAGHWLESGNNPRVRYNEDNIHGQRLQCNFFKGGDSGQYERNLRNKIGDARVDALLDLRGGTVKRKIDDYKEIENYYKSKLQELTA